MRSSIAARRPMLPVYIAGLACVAVHVLWELVALPADRVVAPLSFVGAVAAPAHLSCTTRAAPAPGDPPSPS